MPPKKSTKLPKKSKTTKRAAATKNAAPLPQKKRVVAKIAAVAAEEFPPQPPAKIISDLFHLNMTSYDLQKKKHYWFYGPYEYCKGMMDKFVNDVPPNSTALMYDPPTFNNIRNDTKYILIEHYSRANRIYLPDFLDLTSPRPSWIFRGGRRTYKSKTLVERYVARDDVQLLIWSRYHPFYVYARNGPDYNTGVGADQISAGNANALRSHIHIIKLDARERRSAHMVEEREEAAEYVVDEDVGRAIPY